MTLNTNIIDFDVFFNNTVSIDILDTLHSYNLFDNDKLNFKNRTIKQVIAYFTVYHIIKLMDLNEINKRILVVQPDIINNNTELLKYFEAVKPVKQLFIKTIKTIKQKYPDRILMLKEYKDLTNPDTINFIFNKCNEYTMGSKRLFNNLNKELGLKL